jgi:hypothetical protein
MKENRDHSEPYDPTLELSSFRPPDLDLLLDYPDEKFKSIVQKWKRTGSNH